MEQSTRITPFREPWNKGKLVGQKAPNFELADTCSTTIGFADGDDYFCRLIAA